MTGIEPPRYVVCDQNRRAPNNVMPSQVTYGPAGECGRFDLLEDAIRFAKATWHHESGLHSIVIQDRATPSRAIVWSEPARES